MLLYLINPVTPQVTTGTGQKWFDRFRIWKPLGLLTVAALTPPEWGVRVLDENHGIPDYAALPRPDVVGITAFTSQAGRAYELAARFRALGVPVVMGGIHASMCPDEAAGHVDAVVVGEAEGVWPQVLADARAGLLRGVYRAPPDRALAPPPARHDLLPAGYVFGAVQTTRGCPLSCTFCSVTAFNGARYRHRPIADVVAELKLVPERLVLIVDDNLIGTSPAHVARAKELFRAMIAAGLRKRWIAQVTVNVGDDEELLRLAARAGCMAVFIGFESPTPEGLAEVGKKFNAARGRDVRATVRRIQAHGILVVGSFILGLDADGPGAGRRIADAASRYGVDLLNTLFLTPLPGTRLWDALRDEGRLTADAFPGDWQFYTLTFPVARYKRLSRPQVAREMEACERRFYSVGRILGRALSSVRRWRHPLVSLIANLGYRGRLAANHRACRAFVAAGPARPGRLAGQDETPAWSEVAPPPALALDAVRRAMA